METEFKPILRAQVQNNRFTETIDCLREDIERLRKGGCSHKLIRAYIENLLEVEIKDHASFRDCLKRRYNLWDGVVQRKKQNAGFSGPKKEIEYENGFPAFLRYDPSKEPKKETAIERLNRDLEERWGRDNEHKSGVPDFLKYDRSQEPPEYNPIAKLARMNKERFGDE